MFSTEVKQDRTVTAMARKQFDKQLSGVVTGINKKKSTQ